MNVQWRYLVKACPQATLKQLSLPNILIREGFCLEACTRNPEILVYVLYTLHVPLRVPTIPLKRLKAHIRAHTFNLPSLVSTTTWQATHTLTTALRSSKAIFTAPNEQNTRPPDRRNTSNDQDLESQV